MVKCINGVTGANTVCYFWGGKFDIKGSVNKNILSMGKKKKCLAQINVQPFV